MKYSIVEINGRQFWFEIDKYYDLNFLNSELGKKVFFNHVLFLKDDEKVYIGTPFLKNVQVKANIMNHLQGSKITVYKMKSKKKFRRTIGFRQKLTRVLIEDIKVN
jgi:large subunit ribosomal protein L21